MKPDSLALLDILLKGTCVLLTGFAASAVLRRASAAHRSLSWLAVFAVMSLLPLGVLIEPMWALPVVMVKKTVAPGPAPRGADELAPVVAAVSSEAPPSGIRLSSVSWTTADVALACYLSVGALLLAFRLAGSWQLRLVWRCGKPADETIRSLVSDLVGERGIVRPVLTVISDRVSVPMTWGVLRPVLVLPAGAKAWPDQELRSALEHELAHVAHRDAARRWLGTLVCAVWWPHPLVWLAARAWRLEQERSCDDAVIRAGSDAQRYATQLLDVARTARLGRLQSAAALVMAVPSGLETRLRGVVDTAVSRSEARAGGRLLAAICTLTVAGAALSLGARAADAGGVRPLTVRTKFIEITDDSAALRDATVKQWQGGETMILDASDAEAMLRRLSQTKGVDIMSAPSVTTKPGQKATVEVVREFIYPTEFEFPAKSDVKPKAGEASDVMTPVTFEMMPLGVIVDVTAGWSGNQVDLESAARVNEFKGFAKAGPAEMTRDKKGVWRVKDPSDLAVVKRNESPASTAVTASAKDMYESAKAGMKLKPDEVWTPQFTTQKWEGKTSLNPGQWMVAALKHTKGKKEAGRGQVWVLISASEAAKTEAKTAVPSPGPGVETLLQKARGIVLPVVEFKNASVAEAVEFLRAKSRELDPEKQGVNILLRNDPPSRAEITLSLRDVPLNEAIRYTSELAGMELVWEIYAAIIRPIGEPEGMEQFTRVYNAPGDLLGTETDAKKWLAAQRVKFSEGASATFDKSTSKLTVKNVPQELREVEAILQRRGMATDLPKPAIIQRAAQIIFPSVNFRDATLEEAVEFLRVRSRDFDPSKKGINIVLVAGMAKSPAKITLDLKQVPLAEALRYVASLAAARIIARSDTIEIAPLTSQSLPTTDSPIEFAAKETSTDSATGLFTATGEATTEVAGMQIKAGKITYDRKTDIIEATGGFEIRKGDTLHTSGQDSSRAVIDVKTGTLRIIGPVHTKVAK